MTLILTEMRLGIKSEPHIWMDKITYIAILYIYQYTCVDISMNSCLFLSTALIDEHKIDTLLHICTFILLL